MFTPSRYTPQNLKHVPTSALVLHVVTHLLTQGARTSGTLYENGRDRDGRTSALGCLSPDPMRWLRECKDTLTPQATRVLWRLEYIHDNVPAERWREQIKALLEEEGLFFSEHTLQLSRSARAWQVKASPASQPDWVQVLFGVGRLQVHGGTGGLLCDPGQGQRGGTFALSEGDYLVYDLWGNLYGFTATAAHLQFGAPPLSATLGAA